MRRLSRSSRTSCDIEKHRLSRGSRDSLDDSHSSSARTPRRGCWRSSVPSARICAGLAALATAFGPLWSCGVWLFGSTPHGSASSVLTRTDLSRFDASIVSSMYEEEISSIRSSADVPKVVASLRRRLSSSLGGQWDMYTDHALLTPHKAPRNTACNCRCTLHSALKLTAALHYCTCIAWIRYTTDGGMMSYSLPCVQYVEFTSPRETWVALLCQCVRPDSTKPLARAAAAIP